MAKASARHILVKTEAECLKLKTEIEGGKDFGAARARHRADGDTASFYEPDLA